MSLRLHVQSVSTYSRCPNITWSVARPVSIQSIHELTNIFKDLAHLITEQVRGSRAPSLSLSLLGIFLLQLS